MLGGVSGFLHSSLSFAAAAGLLNKFIDIAENFVLVTLKVLPVEQYMVSKQRYDKTKLETIKLEVDCRAAWLGTYISVS